MSYAATCQPPCLSDWLPALLFKLAQCPAPARCRTALHLASVKGHLNVIHLLAAAGADMSQPDANGNTPLSEACACGQDAAIDLLMSKGAK